MKVTEIFKSLQGEGRNQGRTCIFIRLAGCNLNCHWCDTEYSRSGGKEMGPDEILGLVEPVSPPYLCITGGEPLMQAAELEPLLASLHKRGAVIDIETNGTYAFTRVQPYASICMDVKCPSSGEHSDLSLLDTIRPQDSVKFVLKDETDCRYAQEIMASHRIAGEIFFSPVAGSNYATIAQFILANNLPVRFQLQLHKIIGVK
jgi:7-carboxy-7-deazaguanine synthase